LSAPSRSFSAREREGLVSSRKPALKAELLAQLGADLETLERAHRATIEGATHEEAKPENDKDTRALEQSYLARGQASRIDELRGGIVGVAALSLRDFAGRPAALGALVTLEEDGAVSTLLVAPAGGGARLAGGTVQVVTPPSPLGRAVLGKEAGDAVEVVVAGKTRTLQVTEVA
jgi:transcription elongation GreA/GreB family factor